MWRGHSCPRKVSRESPDVFELRIQVRCPNTPEVNRTVLLVVRFSRAGVSAPHLAATHKTHAGCSFPRHAAQHFRNMNSQSFLLSERRAQRPRQCVQESATRSQSSGTSTEA